MALNVAPVTGLTPAQVAVKLRTLVKNAYQQQGGSSSGGSVVARMNERREKAIYRRSQAEAQLAALFDAIPRRKPIEMRQLLQGVRGHLSYMDDYLNGERQYANKAAMYAGGSTSQQELLKEIYALVQALPTQDHMPVGDAENTIRAIVAICKAHFGMLEQTLAPAPHVGAKEEILDVLMKLASSPEVVEAPPESGPVYGEDGEILNEDELESELLDDEEDEEDEEVDGMEPEEQQPSPITWVPGQFVATSNVTTTPGTGGPF